MKDAQVFLRIGKIRSFYKNKVRVIRVLEVVNWSEGLANDFAKMAFIDPSRNTDQGVYPLCKC